MSQPIIVNSLWRSCSAYFALKFREDPDFMMFYEPLHPTLAKNTNADYDELHKGAVSTMRQPKVPEHYWTEFPLKPEGGTIFDFDERFALDNFVLEPGSDEDPELERYIRQIVAHAEEAGKTPVLKFNRALLRAEWMKDKLGARSIFLLRNPGQVFASYLTFPQRDYNFINHIANIIHKNQKHPVFAEFAAWSGLDKDQKAFIANPGDHENRYLKSEQLCRDMVALIWFTALAEATHHADLILDANAVGREWKAQDASQAVRELTGSKTFDLSDFSLPQENLEFEVSDQAMQIIGKAVSCIQPDWSALDGVMLSDHNREIVDRVIPSGGSAKPLMSMDPVI